MIALLAVIETRKIFGGVSGVERAIFYLLTVVTLFFFFLGIIKRYKKYSAGRKPVGWKWKRRRSQGGVPEVSAPISVLTSSLEIASNKTIAKQKHKVGAAHFLLFWGFTGLFVATVIVSLDYDFYGNITRVVTGKEESFFKGSFYLIYNLVFNAAGAAAIIGTALLAWRRITSDEIQLDYTRAEKPEGGYSRKLMALGDKIFIFGLLTILVTGFLVQGLRIEGEGFPSFEKWTWLGWLAGKGWYALGVGSATARSLHAPLWWLHILMALAFVAYLPWSKALHILSSPANLLIRDPVTTRQVPSPPEGHSGYISLEDFSPKELLGFDACTKCGRCHGVCPARTAGAPLSPRDLILDLRQWADRKSKIPMIFDWEERTAASGPSLTDGVLAGEVISERTLWSCTTCMACVEICPVGIEHVPTIIQLRRSLVDQGVMDPTLQTALQNIATQGNSFGKSSRMRARWTKGLDFEITDARKEPVEYLWFLGDFASFDERLGDVSRSLAKVLHDAGVSFGILFEDERNSGNDVRRVGEEGLFEMLVEQNLKAFEKASFDKIFTTDPHSLNTLRNEYPAFGLEAPVLHYSELLASLLFQRKVEVTMPVKSKVTYHDPCYLGRYNRVFDAPRAVIEGVGCELIEMPRHGSNSFCCGAGGGRIWMDDSYLSERPSENRIREAAELDVTHFVVACPKDYTMFSDAVKTTGNEGRLQVVDIVELFAQAVGMPLVTVGGDESTTTN